MTSDIFTRNVWGRSLWNNRFSNSKNTWLDLSTRNFLGDDLGDRLSKRWITWPMIFVRKMGGDDLAKLGDSQRQTLSLIGFFCVQDFSALRAADTRENGWPSLALHKMRTARARFAKAIFSPRCARQISEKTGDPVWHRENFLRAARARYHSKKIPKNTFCKLFFALPLCFLQMNRSTFVFCPSALTQCCPSISRYQKKRVTWSSVAKFFSALRALGLQKQNFLRAARAR